MILSCGDALIDMLPGVTRGSEPAYVPHAGGASLNTAIALGRLGVPTGFFSGISNDLFGRKIAQALSRSNVGIRHAVRSDLPTTLAFVDLKNGQAAYTFYSDNAADRMLAETDLPELGPEITTLQFGAISLAQEPCGTAYEALMRRERESRLIVLDPNIRPDFIKDRDGHVERMRRMIAMADIIKISAEDLAWFEDFRPAAVIAEDWLTRGAKLVVFTDGPGEVAAYSVNGSASAKARSVKVADTVGAGDTFSAGLLTSFWKEGLLSKKQIAGTKIEAVSRALELGNRAAAVTVSRSGANPPWANEIDL